jgi:hypothetical protein
MSNTTKNKINYKKTPAMTNPLIAGMAKAQNVTTTANGAKSNRSTLDACLDYFGAGASMRTRSDADVIDLFSKAFYQDRLIAMKTLFSFRDIRAGAGERKTFRTVIRWLAQNYTDVLVKNFDNIAFFGRYDDFYSLVGTPAETQMFEFIGNQLAKDAVAATENKPISLLAKWLKSTNTSSTESRRLGYITAKALEFSPKKYRKVLSALRNKIDILESKLSSKRYSEIDYEKVPSKASLQHRKAFLKRDPERYKQYLSSVEKGEAKINSATLYPYEIIRPIEIGNAGGDELRTLDLQWKNQPNWLGNNPHKGLVICDTSGSMAGLPILVSVSLAIYFAERNVGPFKDTFITFSENPTLQIIRGNTIAEKVRGLNRGGWMQSTNIQAAFDLILNTAVKNKLSAADLPSTIYVISDMQFNVGTGYNNKTNFEVIKEKYERAGYELPKLVWWNVNATNKDFPVTVDDNGTCIVSGCSPSILKSVLSAKTFTPIDVMLEKLNDPRYDVVKV